MAVMALRYNDHGGSRVFTVKVSWCCIHVEFYPYPIISSGFKKKNHVSFQFRHEM